MSEGMVAIDSDGRFIYANEQAEHLLERPRSALIGGSAWATLSRVFGEGSEQLLHEAAARHAAAHYEHYNPELRRWYHSAVFPTSSGGATVRFQDITDQKEIASRLDASETQLKRIHVEERKRSQDLQKQEDLRKSQFLAVLSHELRNPLAPISNAAGILRRIGSKDPHLEWASEVIDRQVKQMTRLIDELLDIERISRGTFAIRKEPTTLERIVTLALETSLPHVNAANHRLRVLLPQQQIVLDTDRVRIAQVISNLLNNAAKYTQQEGTIDLSASLEAHELVLRVEDNGIGFPSDVASRLFDPFMQLRARAPSSFGGLGVGLTLVQGIVALHGGTVEATSPGPGKGSVFTVRLPAQSSKGAPKAPEHEEAAEPARALRILIADDNKDAAETLAEFLYLDRHTVRVVYDGASALAAAQSFQPEVALLDIGMPRMDGYELAHRLREQHGRDMILIAITGWGQPVDRKRALGAGFDEHVTKPFDPDELHAMLTRFSRKAKTAS